MNKWMLALNISSLMRENKIEYSRSLNWDDFQGLKAFIQSLLVFALIMKILKTKGGSAVLFGH